MLKYQVKVELLPLWLVEALTKVSTAACQRDHPNCEDCGDLHTASGDLAELLYWWRIKRHATLGIELCT